MKAMILAAGLGTRLRPLTESMPKPLVPIHQKPLITYTLRLLQKYRVQEVVINLHHQGEKFKNLLKTGADWDMVIHYSEEPLILGTGGGLKKVQSYFTDETFIMINGDILVDINLDEVISFHRSKKAISTLVLREDPDAVKWGAVGIDPNHRIHQIRGRPWSSQGQLARRMFSGIHVIEPEIFEHLRDGAESDIIESYINLISRGKVLSGYTMTGYWMDIGTHEHYKQVQDDLREGKIALDY